MPGVNFTRNSVITVQFSKIHHEEKYECVKSISDFKLIFLEKLLGRLNLGDLNTPADIESLLAEMFFYHNKISNIEKVKLRDSLHIEALGTSLSVVSAQRAFAPTMEIINSLACKLSCDLQRACNNPPHNKNVQSRDMNTYVTYLQILYVQAQMLIIKSADQDWNDFMLSCETYENILRFFDQAECSIKQNERLKFNITHKQISQVFEFCQYNFALSLAYHRAPKPANAQDAVYCARVDELKNIVNEEIAYAIANAEKALALCISGLGCHPGTGTDDLLGALVLLTTFYKDYVDCKTLNRERAARGETLAARAMALDAKYRQALFFPNGIRKELNMPLARQSQNMD